MSHLDKKEELHPECYSVDFKWRRLSGKYERKRENEKR